MAFLKVLPVLALLAGCATAPEQDDERPSQVVKDPTRIHGFFMKMIREDKPAIAAEVTSLQPHELTLGVNNTIAPDLTRRVLLGFEQHSVRINEDKESGVVRWCNNEFGLSYEFPLISKFKGKVWQVQITREQIEGLANAGLNWFRRQREVADGRIYAYPPDWKAAPVAATCDCAKRTISN